MQTLFNSIALLNIPDELVFTIIGAVILIGVAADEIMRRFASRFRSQIVCCESQSRRDRFGGNFVPTR